MGRGKTGQSIVRTQAVVRERNGEVVLREVTVRSPRPGEVLIRMGAAGICHSDLHVLNGNWPQATSLVLGHEGAGYVAAIGEGVTGVTAGDLVALTWFAACGVCSQCQKQRPWLCGESASPRNAMPDGSTPIISADSAGEPVHPYLGVGAFSEYAVLPERAVVPLPPEVSVEEAAIISCAVTTGIGAVRNTAQVEAGTTVVVAGCGGVGQAIIMGLVQAGAEQIVVIDRSQAKLDLAMELGATKTALAFDSSQKVQALTTDRGFDYAFDAVGAPSVTEELSQLLGPGGKLVLVGMPAKGAHASFETWSLVGRGITILGSNYGSSVPHRDFVELAEARLSGALPLAKLVGERIQLSDAATAVQNLPKAEGPRSVVVFSQADGP